MGIHESIKRSVEFDKDWDRLEAEVISINDQRGIISGSWEAFTISKVKETFLNISRQINRVTDSNEPDITFEILTGQIAGQRFREVGLKPAYSDLQEIGLVVHLKDGGWNPYRGFIKNKFWKSVGNLEQDFYFNRLNPKGDHRTEPQTDTSHSYYYLFQVIDGDLGTTLYGQRNFA